MNTLTKIQATCLLLCMGAASAFAQSSGSLSNSGSVSNSGSNSGSSSNSGPSSSVSGAGNGYVGSVTSTSGSSSSSSTKSASNAQSGVSTVNVSIANVSKTGSNGSSGSGTNGTANGAAALAAGTTGDPTTSVNYGGTQTIKTNPAIAAPALTTTLSDTCMGSISLGLSLAGFGATGGTTMVDQACVRRLDAREFRAMGLNDVALALLCQADANRRAVEATGHLCPGTTAPLAKAPQHDVPALSDDEKYRDPLVRSRMGLAPLDDASATTGSAATQASNGKPAVSSEATTFSVPAPASQDVSLNPSVQDMVNKGAAK